MVAVSPRRETTLPRMRTIWLVNESRYLALMRGVASEAIIGGWGKGGRLVGEVEEVEEGWKYARRGTARGHVIGLGVCGRSHIRNSHPSVRFLLRYLY